MNLKSLATIIFSGFALSFAPLSSSLAAETESENSITRREDSILLALGTYSPIDFMIPSKLGLTFGYIHDANTTIEFEYLRGRLTAIPFVVEDLGAIDEQRLSLIGRSYFGMNSFNISYGVSYFDLSVNLGSRFLDEFLGEDRYAIDLVQIRSLGLVLGFGNRWTINKNITLGVDWVSWAQPIYAIEKRAEYIKKTANNDAKREVETVLNLASFLPRFAFLKLQLGISF